MSAEMETLAARMEALAGPDREVDCLIARAVGIIPIGAAYEGTAKIGDLAWLNGCGFKIPAYTASLDVAMSLVPEGWEWQVSDNGHAGVWFIDRNKPEPPDDGWQFPLIGIQTIAKAATPALALCAAALRARARPTTTGESGL